MTVAKVAKLPWAERVSEGRRRYGQRKQRESLAKRLGKVAKLIRARDEHKCVYCFAAEEAEGAHLHLDHLLPRSMGGVDAPSNLVTACRRCNSARQNMTVAQWAAYAREKYGLVFSPQAIYGRARRKLKGA